MGRGEQRSTSRPIAMAAQVPPDAGLPKPIITCEF